ncbi:MAG TPA: hypothetical protein DCE52_08250, partial [Rhodobacteraceae bacterium]|nr:hypothetical protein [Paracoccaceae bacterium]
YYTDVSTPVAYRDEIIRIGTAAIAWARQNSPGNDLSDPVTPNSAQELYNLKTAYKESWDPELKAFVWTESGVRYKRVNGADTRKIPEDLDAAEKEDVSAKPDNRFFKFNPVLTPFAFNENETPVDFLTRLDNANPDSIRNINHRGRSIRNMIEHVLYQSWEYMTHTLNTDVAIAGKEENRKILLQKIWEYRQWHYDYILYKTKDDLNESASTAELYDSGQSRLTEWAAAGSTTLTSDIDVNLKGTNTEAAVEEFNNQFEEDGWLYEPGIVYDVNVYAIDYLHKEATFGSGMVNKVTNNGIKVTTDLHGNLLKEVNTNTVPETTLQNKTAFGTGLAGKEAGRKGRAVGGFNGSNPVLIATDKFNQELWSQVKVRIYMTESEFNAYWTASRLPNSFKTQVLQKYNAFRTELFDEMLFLQELDIINDVTDQNLTGVQQLNELAKNIFKYGKNPDPETVDSHKFNADAANLLMLASNFVYEGKLETIYEERNVLKGLVTQYDAAQTTALNAEIESQLVLVRNLVSEATLFANEAYVTDGTVNHVVVGVQGGVPLTVTNSESLNSVVENMADAVKEIVRHGEGGNLGEAAFKAGKYMYRLADAALNMGYNEPDAGRLYIVGNEIANIIKKTISDPNEQYTQSALTILNNYLSVSTPEELKTVVINLGTDIIKWANSTDRPNGYENLPSGRVSPNGEQESYNETSIYTESWDPEKEAFVWQSGNNLYKRKEKFDSTKIPEDLTPSQIEDVTPPADLTDVPADDKRRDLRNFQLAPDYQGETLTWQPNEIPAAFLTRLDGNTVSLNSVRNLNPKGKAIRDIIQNPMYESWEYMVRNLNQGADDGKRKVLLRKIWEYRQWHHDYMLLRSKRTLNAESPDPDLFDNGQQRLTKWSASGSATLTSDIDVNLKGTDTEAAVKEFNSLYKTEGWMYEPGVIYDVNVYALDFMHVEANIGFGMVDNESQDAVDNIKPVLDLHGNVLFKFNTTNDQRTEDFTAKGSPKQAPPIPGTGIHGKEGGRKDLIAGGFKKNNLGAYVTSQIETDIVNQSVWPHVKARVYMTKAEFDSYWDRIAITSLVKTTVITKYETYFNSLAAKMLELEDKAANAYPVSNVTGVASNTGIQQLNEYAKAVVKLGKNPDPEVADPHKFEGDAADLLMAASNRLYEEKLVDIHALRVDLKTDITAYNSVQTEPLNLQIEEKLVVLRDKVSEATLLANEAYISDGAVNHTVVGIQMKAAIKLTNSESCDAIIENLADILKEATRHGGTDLTSNANIGEASFKAGKYMYRLADAAINMGYTAADIFDLYRAGNEISNNIKNKGDITADQQYALSATEINDRFSVTTPAALKTKITQIVIDFMIWKKAQAAENQTFATDSGGAVGGAKAIIAANEAPADQSEVGSPHGHHGNRHDPVSGQILVNNSVPYDPRTDQLAVNLRQESHPNNGRDLNNGDPVNLPLSQSVIGQPQKHVEEVAPQPVRQRRFDVRHGSDANGMADDFEEKISTLTVNINHANKEIQTIKSKWIKSKSDKWIKSKSKSDKQRRSDLNTLSARLSSERRQLLNNLRSIDVNRYNRINRSIAQ